VARNLLQNGVNPALSVTYVTVVALTISNLDRNSPVPSSVNEYYANGQNEIARTLPTLRIAPFVPLPSQERIRAPAGPGYAALALPGMLRSFLPTTLGKH
jgi:hypothetical protein